MLKTAKHCWKEFWKDKNKWRDILLWFTSGMSPRGSCVWRSDPQLVGLWGGSGNFRRWGLIRIGVSLGCALEGSTLSLDISSASWVLWGEQVCSTLPSALMGCLTTDLDTMETAGQGLKSMQLSAKVNLCSFKLFFLGILSQQQKVD